MKHKDFLIDLALNIVIPFSVYMVAKNYFHTTELTALIWSSVYPILDTFVEFFKDRSLNIISATVFLGTLASILGIFFGGDEKLLLIRESFFTGFLGIACLLSLFTPYPLISYFAREFVAGKDKEKRDRFTEKLKLKPFVHIFKVMTFVWGIIYVSEFILRVIIVYSLPAPVVLIISPIILTTSTAVAIAWSVKFAHRRADKLKESQ